MRADLGSRPFLILLGLGAIVRVTLMTLYFPAVMLWFDSPRYARVGGMEMFGDFWMPAGYPFFLQALHAISRELWFTIAVQHLLGLGTATILFLALRRLGAGCVAACVSAAVALFSGDQLYLEHTIMADFFLTFLTAAGLGAAVFGLTRETHLRWLALGSALLASAALVRSVGVVLWPILVLCTLLWTTGTWPKRCAAFLAALLPGLGVYLCYVAIWWAVGGEYLGLSDMRGWNLYSRVAPFADCQKLGALPPELAILCEQRAPVERPGPFGYVWDAESIARRNFPLGPKSGAVLGVFAQRVIRGQADEYLSAVGIDLARHVNPTLGGNRPFSGQPRDIVSFGWRDPKVEQLVVTPMSSSYRGTEVRLRGKHALGFYQQYFRVGGIALALLFILSLAGMIFARGSLRLGVSLFGFSAFGLYLLPVLTVSYDFRYGIPPQIFLVAAGVLGAVAMRARFRGGLLVA